MIWEGYVDSEQVLCNFPDREVRFHTDADVTVAFWFPKKGAAGNWGAEIAIEAPGQWLACGPNMGRITGTANVQIF